MDLGSHEENRFGITFNFGYELPTIENFGIEHKSGSSQDSVSVGFYKGATFFIISPYENGIISASKEGDKAKYTLQPTWFVNYFDASDSVQISGEFNEP